MTKKKKKTVLLTSAGTATAVNVLSSLRASELYEVEIVAIDQSPDAAALYLADDFELVPPVSEPDYLDTVLRLAIAKGVSFVYPLYSREIIRFARRVAMFREQGVELSIPSPAVVELCNDKKRFQEFLSIREFGHPHTFPSLDAVTDFPVFVKPRSGSSSKSCERVQTREELEFYVKRNSACLIQEWVDWKELTVDCYVSRTGFLVACVPRYRVKVKDGKSVISETAYNEYLVKQVEHLLMSLEFRGACNVQLFFDGKEQVKFIEVNPRLAAGGLPLATRVGANIPELMLLDADGVLSSERRRIKAGVRMIRYLTELYINEQGYA